MTFTVALETLISSLLFSNNSRTQPFCLITFYRRGTFSEENQQVAMTHESRLLFYIHLLFAVFPAFFSDYRYTSVAPNPSRALRLGLSVVANTRRGLPDKEFLKHAGDSRFTDPD
jgi:hypothetical protein